MASENFRDEMTIAEARRALESGADCCPLCHATSAIRKRYLRPPWAALLKRIVNDQKNGEYIAVREVYADILSRIRANDWPYLRHYGLLETLSHDGEEKTHSGKWRATAYGHLFVAGLDDAPEYIAVQFNNVVARSSSVVTFEEVMRRPWKFDLRDVLNVTDAEIQARGWNSQPNGGGPQRRTG